jgi:small subunit ribosomal protein S21
MPLVHVNPNEPLEKALRRLKKKIEREGILKQVKSRKHYEKPSVVKRRKMREARARSRFRRY